MLQLMVLYPQPADVQQFEADYIDHIALLHEKTGIPLDMKPYTTVKFIDSPEGPATFYRMFAMPFDLMESLQATMSSSGMQAVAADASRISTGGPITILIGKAE